MNIYDNSNLNESYAGVTTPMTFSFVRRVYQKVYVQFLKILGVRDQEIEYIRKDLENMVVYIGGRLYYNLGIWHKMLTLLPVYQLNRKFMEDMMGIDPKYRGKVEIETPQNYFSNLLRTSYLIIRISFLFIFMESIMKKFLEDFTKKKELANIQIKSALKNKYSIKKMMNIYAGIERDISKDFRAPIVNDFAVMVSVGLLNLACEKFFGSAKGKLISGYFARGQKGLKSLKAGLAFYEITEAVKNNKKYRLLFASNDESQILTKITNDKKYKSLNSDLKNYIRLYGDRVPGELKLETLSFQNNPLILIRLLKSNLSLDLKSIRGRKDVLTKSNYEESINKLSFFKIIIFIFLNKWVRASITRREESRFQRIVAFGIVKDFLLKIGKLLKDKNKLEKETDIFYLTLEDLENSSQIDNYISVVKNNKKKEIYFKKLSLPNRIETKTEKVDVDKYIVKTTEKVINDKISLKGSVASLGGRSEVVGEAIVLRNFDSTRNFRGKILVTVQTDPGWTIIFPFLKAIVVERGGVLSHAAIVSRELGIPCIVGVTGATDKIKNGEEVLLNLSDGSVANT